MPHPTVDLKMVFREFRRKLGFSRKDKARDFLAAKDITPTVDFDYVKILNERLKELVDKINGVVADEIKIEKLTNFKTKHIDRPYNIIKESNIFPVLNNQGRRPEDVYFNWMRGYVFSNYFLKALGLIFEVNTDSIKLIGDDDLRNLETFKRSAKADLEISIKVNKKIRIEMQMGFTGLNDIKKHKVIEAKKVFHEHGVHTVAIHFDLFNGQVAFINLDKIDENSVNWVARQQMEGQLVFNIDQTNFIWKITERPPVYSEINFK